MSLNKLLKTTTLTLILSLSIFQPAQAVNPNVDVLVQGQDDSNGLIKFTNFMFYAHDNNSWGHARTQYLPNGQHGYELVMMVTIFDVGGDDFQPADTSLSWSDQIAANKAYNPVGWSFIVRDLGWATFNGTIRVSNKHDGGIFDIVVHHALPCGIYDYTSHGVADAMQCD